MNDKVAIFLKYFCQQISAKKDLINYNILSKSRNEAKKNSIEFFIKLNEDDWMSEKGVKARNQCKIFKL